MESSTSGAKNRRLPPWLGSAVVYAISLGCLAWVYHDFDWQAELPRVLRIHWAWIALAVVCDVFVYISQAWRWNLLLTPIKELGLWRSVQAIYIGLFANEILPLRSGEVIRCYLLAHWNHVPLPRIISSALIERLIDGIWLMSGFAVISLLVPVGPGLRTAALALGVVVLILGALVAFAVFNRSFAHEVVTANRFAGVLRSLIEGLNIMARARTFFPAALSSIVYLTLQVIPIFAIVRGYDVPFSLGDAAITLVVIRLSTVVPGLPGNIGLFHAAAFTALNKLLGVDEQTAKSLAAVLFFMITVPLLAAGAVALAATGLKIRELQRRATDEASATSRIASTPEPSVGAK